MITAIMEKEDRVNATQAHFKPLLLEVDRAARLQKHPISPH
jgi:hypothetical protein